MPAFKKYCVGLVAVLFTVSVLGAPVMVFRCSMCAKQKVAQCCPSAPEHEVYGGSIKALPCFSATDIGAPLKANVTPVSYKNVSTRVASLGVVFSEPTKAVPIAYLSFRQDPREYLPSPLILTHILRI